METQLDIRKRENKEHVFWVRVGDSQYTKIQKLCKKYNVNRSVIIRKLIDKALKN